MWLQKDVMSSYYEKLSLVAFVVDCGIHLQLLLSWTSPSAFGAPPWPDMQLPPQDHLMSG